MSADLDLLKLAAKAAGLNVNFEDYTDPADWFANGYDEDTGDVLNWWNPLRSDADALRLVAGLRLIVKPGKHPGDGCTVESQRDGIAGATAFYADKLEQMRRAIVLVAAEIGRSFPN